MPVNASEEGADDSCGSARSARGVMRLANFLREATALADLIAVLTGAFADVSGVARGDSVPYRFPVDCEVRRWSR